MAIMQANKRAFRIGQEKDCRVYYFAYEETMQMDALRLIAAKMKAAGRVNGELDTGEALDAFDDTMAGDIMSALKSMLENELNTEAIAQEINNEWDEIKAGRLALSNSQHFHQCTSRDDAKRHWRELMRKYHPDANVGAAEERATIHDISQMFAEANTTFMEKESGFAGDYEMSEPDIEEAPITAVADDEQDTSLEALHESYHDARKGIIIPKRKTPFLFLNCKNPLDIEIRYKEYMEEYYPEVLAEMNGKTDKTIKTKPAFGGGFEVVKDKPTSKATGRLREIIDLKPIYHSHNITNWLSSLADYRKKFKSTDDDALKQAIIQTLQNQHSLYRQKVKDESDDRQRATYNQISTLLKRSLKWATTKEPQEPQVSNSQNGIKITLHTIGFDEDGLFYSEVDDPLSTPKPVLDDSLEALNEAYHDARQGIIISKNGNAFSFASCRTPLDIELRYDELMEKHYPKVLAKMKAKDRKKEPSPPKERSGTIPDREPSKHQEKCDPSYWPNKQAWAIYMAKCYKKYQGNRLKPTNVIPKQLKDTINALDKLYKGYMRVIESNDKGRDEIEQTYKYVFVVQDWLQTFQRLETSLAKPKAPLPQPPAVPKNQTLTNEKLFVRHPEKAIKRLSKKSLLNPSKKKVSKLFEHDGKLFVAVSADTSTNKVVLYEAHDFYNAPPMPSGFREKLEAQKTMGKWHAELIRVGRDKRPFMLHGPELKVEVCQYAYGNVKPVPEELAEEVVPNQKVNETPEPVGAHWVFGVHQADGSLRPQAERDNVAAKQLSLFG